MATEIVQQNWRKARKEHKCYLCGVTIHKGETYMVEKTLYDDFYDGPEFYTIKFCAPCWNDVLPEVIRELEDGDELEPEAARVWACEIDPKDDTPARKAYRKRADEEIYQWWL